MLVAGLDIGTQGVRVLLADLSGRVLAEAESPFPREMTLPQASGAFEQDPRHWRKALLGALREATARLSALGHSPEEIVALSAAGTSGTLCLVDTAGEPVSPALMYSDSRAEVSAVRSCGAAWEEALGTQFGASFGLCKLVWVARHRPARLEAARWILSPADLALGWLSGIWGVSDWTNALKMGYDVTARAWPAFIGQALGLPTEKLPRIDAPGTPIGSVSAQAAAETGLSPRTLVALGATDGNASQCASGAVSLGEWNSTLGTTLVLKGVSSHLVRDPLGRVYCHLHPDGALWLPGGASNTGGDALAQRFRPEVLQALNAAALERMPTDLIVYPLARKGERFPFSAPEAQGFILGEPEDEVTLYTAHLEGLAYVERLAYETVSALGAPVGGVIYATGGVTHSRAALQIRADVLQRELAVPAVPSAAMGAAILAARAAAYASVREAAQAMVRIAERVAPRPEFAAPYAERYALFVKACRERGYLR